MTRRDLFRLLTSAAATAVASAAIDPERLLWVPGKKTISIPPPTSLSGIWEAVDLARGEVRISLFEQLPNEEMCEANYDGYARQWVPIPSDGEPAKVLFPTLTSGSQTITHIGVQEKGVTHYVPLFNRRNLHVEPGEFVIIQALVTRSI